MSDGWVTVEHGLPGEVFVSMADYRGPLLTPSIEVHPKEGWVRLRMADLEPGTYHVYINNGEAQERYEVVSEQDYGPGVPRGPIDLRPYLASDRRSYGRASPEG